MGDWIAFWDSEHSIYVNARHRDVHYRRIAQDIRAHLPAGAAVLDYGCGEALHADLVATSARTLILCEAAPMVRAALARRFGGNPKIEVRTPEEIAALPSGSLDVVVLHSVAQYLTPTELDDLLVVFHRRTSRPWAMRRRSFILPPAMAFSAPHWSGSGARSSPTTGACARTSVSPATARRR
jgi:hypothetical protein